MNIATLNYDLLIELGIELERLSYIGQNGAPPVFKLHGSCNIVPDIGSATISGITVVVPPTGPGDRPWVDRGERVDCAATRCTAVELSTCRQQEDAHSPQRANRTGRGLTCAKGPDPQLPHV